MNRYISKLFGLVSVCFALGCGGNSDDPPADGSSGGAGGCAIDLFASACEYVLNGDTVHRCGSFDVRDGCGKDVEITCGQCPTGHDCHETRCIPGGGQGGSAGSSGDAGIDGNGGEAGSSGTGGAAGQGGNGGNAGEAGSAGQAGGGGSQQIPAATMSLVDPNPASHVYIKSDPHVQAVGIKVTAGNKPIVLQGLTVTGQAVIASQNCGFGEQCAREAFIARAASVWIAEDMAPVGYAKTPDPNTGMANISNMNAALAAGETKTYTVLVTLTSEASMSEPFDRIAVGIANQWDAVIIDADLGSVLGDVQTGLKDQLGASPAVVQTIRPSGILKIEGDAHPAAQIVVAGKDVWVPFARYKATAQYESASIDKLLAFFCTSPVNGCDADNRDFTEVAVASGGTVRGSITPPDGNDWWGKDVDLAGHEINVPKDGSVNFELWGKLAPVVPFGTAAGPDGAARSGHTPALGLVGGYHSQEWDAAYTDKVNVRALGMTGYEQLYADIGSSNLTGNKMTVRMTQPMVVKQQLANVMLANTDMELVRFLVGADSIAPVTLRQLSFWIEKSASLNLQYFKLYRSSFPVEPGTMSLTVNDADAENVFVTFSWNDGVEDTVVDSGYVYALRATVSGATQSSTLKTTLVQGGDSVMTGYLLRDTTGLLQLCGQPGDVPSACPFAGFAWGDGSGKSTWGYQVQAFPVSQLLTAN